jgi:septation ring formation regulator EzrA
MRRKRDKKDEKETKKRRKRDKKEIKRGLGGSRIPSVPSSVVRTLKVKYHR